MLLLILVLIRDSLWVFVFMSCIIYMILIWMIYSQRILVYCVFPLTYRFKHICLIWVFTLTSGGFLTFGRKKTLFWIISDEANSRATWLIDWLISCVCFHDIPIRFPFPDYFSRPLKVFLQVLAPVFLWRGSLRHRNTLCLDVSKWKWKERPFREHFFGLRTMCLCGFGCDDDDETLTKSGGDVSRCSCCEDSCSEAAD